MLAFNLFVHGALNLGLALLWYKMGEIFYFEEFFKIAALYGVLGTALILLAVFIFIKGS